MSNLSLALRQLLRRPGSSLIVIGMLALGIGATTAGLAALQRRRFLRAGLQLCESRRVAHRG
jgi:hypothetical protein